MMLDRDLVAVSPSSVYRVLTRAGRMGGWKRKASRKGAGLQHPPAAHPHWQVDIWTINVGGTFYYPCP